MCSLAAAQRTRKGIGIMAPWETTTPLTFVFLIGIVIGIFAFVAFLWLAFWLVDLVKGGKSK